MAASLIVFESLLNTDIEDYCMSLSVDTRTNLDMYQQITEPPIKIQLAIDYVIENIDTLYKVIQDADVKNNKISIDISQITDPYRIIALWANFKRGF